MPEARVPSTSTGEGTAKEGTAAGPHANVNVQQLADKVYSLLLADGRLAHARGETPLPPTRRGEA